ncbi:MAG TPA: hypothetical protein VIW27_00320 [Gammaproteobacteria bacterium]
MSVIYFTLVGIALYLVSDWLLQRVEASAGRRFEHRSLIFFVILLSLALITFEFIQRIGGTT